MGAQKAPHLTFASKSMSRSITRTGLFLRRQLWVFPIIAVVVLAIIGYGLRRAIETTMKDSLRSHLQALLAVETSMLETWFKSQETIAETQANDLHVRENIYKLLDEVDPTNNSRNAAQRIVRASPVAEGAGARDVGQRFHRLRCRRQE